jgi:hypothetical protein
VPGADRVVVLRPSRLLALQASLQLWFYAIYLKTRMPCDISAKHLQRELASSTRPRIACRKLIRQRLMTQDAEPFKGREPVEVDET